MPYGFEYAPKEFYMSESRKAEFANSLEEGMLVTVVTGERGHRAMPYVAEVVRLTPTQVIVRSEGARFYTKSDEARFWRKVEYNLDRAGNRTSVREVWLSSVGDKWYTARLRPYDEYTERWLSEYAEWQRKEAQEEWERKTKWEALEEELTLSGREILKKNFAEFIDQMNYQDVVQSLNSIWDGVVRKAGMTGDESVNDEIFRIVNRGQTRAKRGGVTYDRTRE